MKLYFEDNNIKLYNDNMLNLLDDIKENSIDCIITDPPYELNFMNKSWDNTGIAFQKETYEKCLKVLKPGGHLLAFGAPRNYHRVACAIEDAGFEIRDSLFWVFGSGFPKSLNIGLAVDKKNGVESKVIGVKEHCQKDFKENNLYAQDEANKNNTKCFGYGTEILKEAQNEWKGWGSQLKPSYEPIVVARKPLEGTLVDNVLKYRIGGINIDECRIPYEDTTNPATNPLYRQENANKYKQIPRGQASNGVVKFTSSLNGVSNLGRFPSNTILTYDETDYEEVCGGFPNTKGSNPNDLGAEGFWFDKGKRDSKQMSHGYNDEGSACRYFYCAKASSRDRDEGLQDFELKKMYGNDLQWGYGNNNGDNFGDRVANVMRKNIHPTVKPTELLQYLIRLISPKGATILDPFMGSGSTGKAVMYENSDFNKDYKFIGIELTDEYLPIAKARILYAKQDKITRHQIEQEWKSKEKCENNKKIGKFF